MSASQTSEQSVVTSADGTVVNSEDTGYVVLGVLGGLSFVFFVVAIVVPVIRWRKRRGSSLTESRASSRRDHARIISEYNQDTVAPLLEEQPDTMVMNRGAPMVSQDRRLTSSRPPTTMLNRKILQTIPNFDDDDSSESSLGKPLEPTQQTFPDNDTDVRLVAGDRRSAALPPIPVAGEPSRSASLAATTSSSSTGPISNAFQRSVSASTGGAASNSSSTFRYPSLGSASSKSSVPTPEMKGTALSATAQRNLAYTPTPSWVPKALTPGSEGSAPGETWWRTPSMPPIPESVRSASISSGHVFETKKASPPRPTAHLHDSNASAGPSTIRHVRGPSAETGTATQSSLSRSSTQHTDHSLSASLVERDDKRMSTLTHGTFGRQGGQPESRDTSYTRPSEVDDVGVLTSVEPKDETPRHVKRMTLDYPREPSPPLIPAPLSAPPHSLRSSHASRSTRPSSQPMPDPQSLEESEPDMQVSGLYRSTRPFSQPTRDPQSPEEPEVDMQVSGSYSSIRPSSQPMPDPQSPAEHEPDVEIVGPYAYGHNEEASSSSEQLIPSTDLVPLLPEIPTLPKLSPTAFEFKFDSTPASRSNSTSTGSRLSRKSARSKGKEKEKEKGHSKTPSKASTMSVISSSIGSKRSLRSLASSIRSGSSGSRSKSRERSKHTRHVTFGDEKVPPQVPTAVPLADIPSGGTIIEQSEPLPPALPQPEPVQRAPPPQPQPPRRASRPLPMLPATAIPGYSTGLPVQANPDIARTQANSRAGLSFR